MTVVNMLEAKTHLSRLVDSIERGQETEVVIARNGRPVARLVPLQQRGVKRLGLLEGKVRSITLEELNESGAEIAALFLGSDP